MAATGTRSRKNPTGDNRATQGTRIAPAAEETLETPKSDFDLARELFVLAEEGDRNALNQLKNHPELYRYVTVYGVTSALRDELAQSMFGKGRLVAIEAIEQEIDSLRQSLLLPSSSPLERVLVEEVAVAWLMLRKAQHCLASFTSGSIADVNCRENRVDRAHQRFLASIRILAQIRRLQIPALVQLNVANQQVNVGS
jgi:hypothetical protein